MLRFKQFVKEDTEDKDHGLNCGHNHDEESEYEGLGEHISHMFHTGGIDPKLMRHINTHGKDSLYESAEPLKVKVKQAVGEALGRFKEAYGRDIGKPVNAGLIPERVRKAVEDHYKKPVSGSGSQQEALAGAAARIGHVAYNDKTMTPEAIGARLAGGNKKTDTVVNNPLVKFGGKTTSRVSSYGGAPGEYDHFHDASMTTSSSTQTCPHATDGCSKSKSIRVGRTLKRIKKIGASCLAKSGGYGFPGTQKKVQINTHLRNAEGSLEDHAILAAHHITTQANAASKKDSIHAIRGQTTDQRGKEIESIADEVSKTNPNVQNNTVLFGYSKDPKEVLAAARKTKKIKEAKKENSDTSSLGVPNIITHSHPGPAYYEDENGNFRLNDGKGQGDENPDGSRDDISRNNIAALKKLRDAHAQAEKEGLLVNNYIVAGGQSLDENGNGIAGTVHRQPTHATEKTTGTRLASHKKASDLFHALDSSVRGVRYWDLHHSGELQDGEPDSHHDEKTGTGYSTVLQDGKKLKIRYHDRNANIGDTGPEDKNGKPTSGQVMYEDRHDGRYADGENKKPVDSVTGNVSSTSNPNALGEYDNGLSHQMHVSYDLHGTKFRHSKPGMLHDAEPSLMQKGGYRYGRKEIPINKE